jgi:hypothetical protein
MGKDKNKWYAAGLCFECQGCGDCCSGPEEGVIWVTQKEVEFVADFLKITPDEFSQRYTRHIGVRRSIIEEPYSKDCIFLEKVNGKKCCAIYPVRPNQCRTWPFWSSNLESPQTWNEAACKCGGMNRGKKFSFDEIEKRRKQKQWW